MTEPRGRLLGRGRRLCLPPITVHAFDVGELTAGYRYDFLFRGTKKGWICTLIPTG